MTTFTCCFQFFLLLSLVTLDGIHAAGLTRNDGMRKPGTIVALSKDKDDDDDGTQLVFPSADATRVTSPFDSVSLFAPLILADLYPEFEGPHYIQDEYSNPCPYGVDKISLDLPTMGDELLDETVIGFALLVNDLYVAETSVSKTSPDILMDDVMYPPIVQDQLVVKLVVVSFDGKLDAGKTPGGIELLPNTNENPNLVLSCAPPYAVQGMPYKNNRSPDYVEAKKKKKLGELHDHFHECKMNPTRSMIEYLPTEARPGPLFPKEKIYQDCRTQDGVANNNKRVLLPIPNEPFQTLRPDLAYYFYVYHSQLEVASIPKKKIDVVYQTICGGRGKSGTLRVTHMVCEDAPPGWQHDDVTADFVVYCPASDNGGKKGRHHDREL